MVSVPTRISTVAPSTGAGSRSQAPSPRTVPHSLPYVGDGLTTMLTGTWIVSLTGSSVSILSWAVYVPGWITLAAAALRPTCTDCDPVFAASAPWSGTADSQSTSAAVSQGIALPRISVSIASPTVLPPA